MDAEEERCMASIKDGLDHHRDTCPLTPRAVYVSTAVMERFGWTEGQRVCGVPVRGEVRVTEVFRVDCPGSAYGAEHQAALWAVESAVRAADGEHVGSPKAA